MAGRDGLILVPPCCGKDNAMKNVKVQRPDGVEITIQVDDDQDVPAGYEIVQTKAKTSANKAAAPRNKKA